MNKKDISVIIPARNESETIGEVISKIRELYPDFEVIVVDDGSGDNTAEVAAKAGAVVFKHPYNIGNGAAVKSGIRIASGEMFLFMDGDGQHRPEDIGGMIEYFPEYDMVVGARSRDNQVSFFRGVGNRLLNWLASYVVEFRVKDLTSGFRAIKADVARNLLYLLPNTYSYPTTITLAVLRSGRGLKYVPINVNSRRKGKSDISPFRDGLRFFMIITKICALYSPLRIFLPISVTLFLLGLSYYLFTYITMGRFTNMSALLFSTSIIIFMMGLVSEQICQMRFEKSEGDRF
ncbi:glycosyltransferase family 2 protein [Deltaproteobacteria bacterium]|nr:glycosyltransferase family 2 protein [Deltaproteobacteria bacterium]